MKNKNSLFVIHRVSNQRILNAIEKVIENSNFQRGKVYTKNSRKLKLLKRNCLVSDLNTKTVLNYLAKRGIAINKRNWGIPGPFRVDLCQLAMYKRGNYYDWHYDFYDHSNQSSKFQRRISMVVLLTDGKKFNGGHLQFAFPGRKNTTANLKRKGDLAVFPSFTMHRVTPVTRGCRVTLNLWISVPV